MAHRWAHQNRNSAATLARKAKYNSAEHRAARKHYKAWIASGHGRCWRCLGRIPPETPDREWNVGHDDLATSVIRGAEHRLCNLKAAARKGNRIANARRKATRFVRATR